MTRLVDFDTASFNNTDQRSTGLWSVFNNKDYQVRLSDAYKYIHRNVGALAYRTGTLITISSGSDIRFEDVDYDTGSYTTANSTTGFFIANDLVSHVRIVSNLDFTGGNRPAGFNVTLNGTVVKSIGTWSRFFGASPSLNITTNLFAVSSGDVITLRMTSGSSLSEDDTNLKTWWSIIPERFS